MDEREDDDVLDLDAANDLDDTELDEEDEEVEENKKREGSEEF